MILVDKPVGLTPLQAIDCIRKNNTRYRESKLSYAGRLDPMASGLLLILVNEENRYREEYLQLEKEYTFELIFGISTDTYDCLGRIQTTSTREISSDYVYDHLVNLIGKHRYPYPTYSSKTVKGKPLWQWARESMLDCIDLPINQFEIKSINHISYFKIQTDKLVSECIKKINRVIGDFRQQELINGWEKLPYKDFKYLVLRAYLSCGSGTYVRGIAQMLEEAINYPVMVRRITRTKIGKYSLNQAIQIVN